MSGLRIAAFALALATPVAAQVTSGRSRTESRDWSRSIEQQIQELRARLGAGPTKAQLEQLQVLEQQLEQQLEQSRHWTQLQNQDWSHLQNQVWSQLQNQDWSQLQNQDWSQLQNQVWSQLQNQDWGQLGQIIGDQVRDVDWQKLDEARQLAEEMRVQHEMDWYLDRHEIEEAVSDAARLQDWQVRDAVEHALDAWRTGSDRSAADEAEFTRSMRRLLGDGPKAPDARQDPADSVYRAARELLNRKEYEQAARLFGRLREESRYSRSAYRADAYYWQAFSLASMGSEESLRQAQSVLDQLVRQYPAERRHKDTAGLMTTVQVRRAQLGSTNAARQVRSIAIEPTLVAEAVAATTADVAVTSAETARLATELRLGVAGGVPLTRRQNAQCRNDDSEIRLIALNALVRMDTTAAMPVLRDVMARRDECAAALRQSSLIVVSRIKTPDAENLLFETARNDPDPDVRRTALIHLAGRNADRAAGIAEESLRSAQDRETQEWALATLARMRNERSWAVIRNYASTSTNSVEARRRAIAALGQSSDSTNATFLRDLYSRVNERELKEAILMSSAFRRAGMDADWLFRVAQDNNEDARLREYAVGALGRRRDVSVDRFVTVYDRTTEKRVRYAAVGILVDRSKTESVAADKLIDIARNETDPDLRKRAIMGLAASNDPRARELLIEILRR